MAVEDIIVRRHSSQRIEVHARMATAKASQAGPLGAPANPPTSAPAPAQLHQVNALLTPAEVRRRAIAALSHELRTLPQILCTCC
jgi:hypothetical protein